MQIERGATDVDSSRLFCTDRLNASSPVTAGWTTTTTNDGLGSRDDHGQISGDEQKRSNLGVFRVVRGGLIRALGVFA
jgi:hypothetical protein